MTAIRDGLDGARPLGSSRNLASCGGSSADGLEPTEATPTAPASHCASPPPRRRLPRSTSRHCSGAALPALPGYRRCPYRRSRRHQAPTERRASDISQPGEPTVSKQRPPRPARGDHHPTVGDVDLCPHRVELRLCHVARIAEARRVTEGRAKHRGDEHRGLSVSQPASGVWCPGAVGSVAGSATFGGPHEACAVELFGSSRTHCGCHAASR